MGTLKILLQRATNLDTVDVFEQRPFCIMEYGTQKVRSKPCTSNGKDPVWETAYKFSICDSKSMTFLIKDESSKKLLGTATLDLTIALKRGKDEATIPVYTTDKYQQGTLSVKVRYSYGEDKDGGKSKNRQALDSSGSSKRGGKRDQGKGAADDDDVDYMSPELDTPTAPAASTADPSNPFLAPPAQAAPQPARSPSWAKRPGTASDSLQRPSSSAISTQMSGDAAVMEDLIEMNKKLNQEVKSLKVAFEDQGQLLQARKAELEELHSMLDRYQAEKQTLEKDLQKAKSANGHAANAEMAKLKELQNEKADTAGQLALVERERQQAQDDLQDAQARYEKLLSEVNQLKLNLKNVTAELQQARSQERFLAEEKEQLQTALRDFENNNQHQFQKVVRQLEDAQRALSAANQEKAKITKELDDTLAALETAKSQTEEHDYLQQQLRKAWSSNLELQNKIRQLESECSDNSPVAAATAAAAAAADNGKPSASLAAELLSENEFLKKQLIATKLELAEAKESQVVAQRNLLRATSSTKRL